MRVGLSPDHKRGREARKKGTQTKCTNANQCGK